MEFKVEAAIPRAANEVWAVLVDIPKIAGCIPGCEDVVERERLADYSAVLKQKLGPFKVTLPAVITVQEVREPNWVQALASGTEKFTGTRIDVTLKMDLQDTEPGHSRMVAHCDMQVAGKLASLGYSVIKKKSEENFTEFRKRLLQALEDCPVIDAQRVVAPPAVVQEGEAATLAPDALAPGAGVEIHHQAPTDGLAQPPQGATAELVVEPVAEPATLTSPAATFDAAPSIPNMQTQDVPANAPQATPVSPEPEAEPKPSAAPQPV